MDDLTIYGDTYDEVLTHLTKVLKIWKDHNSSLSNEKCYMMMQEGVFLNHHVSQQGIHVDPMKIEVKNLLVIYKQKDVRSFLRHASYYRRFIKYFSKIASPLFILFTKDAKFEWADACQKYFHA